MEHRSTVTLVEVGEGLRRCMADDRRCPPGATAPARRPATSTIPPSGGWRKWVVTRSSDRPPASKVRASTCHQSVRSATPASAACGGGASEPLAEKSAPVTSSLAGPARSRRRPRHSRHRARYRGLVAMPRRRAVRWAGRSRSSRRLSTAPPTPRLEHVRGPLRRARHDCVRSSDVVRLVEDHPVSVPSLGTDSQAAGVAPANRSGIKSVSMSAALA